MPTVMKMVSQHISTYSEKICSLNFAAADADVLKGATNITATDAATIEQAKTIADARSSATGTTTYSIVANVSELIAIAKDETIEAKTGLAGATTITATDLSEVTFDKLDAAEAATTIGFDDGATLTVEQLEAITGDGADQGGLALTDTDVITVTGVNGTNLADVTAKLDDNDTIVLADNADISAVEVGDDVVNINLDADSAITVTMTAAQLTAATGLSAQDDDTINVTTLNGENVAATAAKDAFVFAAEDAGVTISSFTTGTDKVDLTALSLTAGTETAALEASKVYFVTANAADKSAFAALNTAGFEEATETADTVSYIVASDAAQTTVFMHTADGTAGILEAELTLVGTFSGANLVADDFVLA